MKLIIRAKAFFYISILVIMWSVLLTGCTGYRAAALPGVEYTDKPDVEATDIAVGQTARITLRSGEQESGEVVSVAGNAVTLGRPSNYGYKETVILFSEIELLEVEQGSHAESLLFKASMGVAIAGAVFLAILAQSLRGLGST